MDSNQHNDNYHATCASDSSGDTCRAYNNHVHAPDFPGYFPKENFSTRTILSTDMVEIATDGVVSAAETNTVIIY